MTATKLASLVNGMRVSKHARRPSAFGEVDETNSVIGLARLHTKTISDADEMLARIQNDLFDMGADLVVPKSNIRKKSTFSKTLLSNYPWS